MGQGNVVKHGIHVSPCSSYPTKIRWRKGVKWPEFSGENRWTALAIWVNLMGTKANVNFPVFVNLVGAMAPEEWYEKTWWSWYTWRTCSNLFPWFNGEIHLTFTCPCYPKKSSRSMYKLQRSQIFKFSIIVAVLLNGSSNTIATCNRQWHRNPVLQLLVQRCTGLEQWRVGCNRM